MTRVLPGATIGIVGGGQLARMMALEARRMGYRVAVLDAEPNGSAGEVVDEFVAGAHHSPEGLRRLAEVSDVITLDTEHVPAALLADIERMTPVYPSSQVMAVVQDRLRQREFLAREGVPQTRYAAVGEAGELDAEYVQFPCIFKTRTSGYDGKGQVRVNSASEIADALEKIGHAPAVAEAFVDFDREVSVVLARGMSGEVRFYPLIENEHRNHVLHLSCIPAKCTEALRAEAEALSGRIAQALGHVGVMAVEFFVTRDGRLLVNEIAPRTHNSGHFSFGAAETSQFEQHVRAVCGLPLGDTTLLRPAVMLNLLGDLWVHGTPDWSHVLSHPGAHLHLYGKKAARPGRKMGHVLVTDVSVEAAHRTAAGIYAALRAPAA